MTSAERSSRRAMKLGTLALVTMALAGLTGCGSQVSAKAKKLAETTTTTLPTTTTSSSTTTTTTTTTTLPPTTRQ